MSAFRHSIRVKHLFHNSTLVVIVNSFVFKRLFYTIYLNSSEFSNSESAVEAPPKTKVKTEDDIVGATAQMRHLHTERQDSSKS